MTGPYIVCFSLFDPLEVRYTQGRAEADMVS